MTALGTPRLLLEVLVVGLLTVTVVLAALGRVGVRRLAASERRLRRTFSSSPAGLALLDRQGRAQEVNPALVRLLGDTRAGLLGHPLPLPPGSDDEALLSRRLEGCLAGGPSSDDESQPRPFEIRLQRPDQGIVVVAVTLTLLERMARSPVVLAQLLDVTDRRREGDARLRLALDAVSMGLWEWDVGAESLQWSESAARLLGIEPDGTSSVGSAVDAIAQPDREGVLHAIRCAVESGTPAEFEFRAGPSGRSRWLLARAQVQQERDGGRRLLGVLLDISSRRSMEAEQAEQAEQRAAAMKRALRVQVVAADLAQALTVDDVLSSIAEDVFPVIGADGLLLALVSAATGRLLLARAAGYQPGFTDRFADLGVDDTHPLAVALRGGMPLFFSSPAEYLVRFPHLGDTVSASEKQAWAFLPLVVPGRGVGTWTLSWSHEHAFSGEERALLTTLAGLAAQALERAHLYEGQRDIATGLQTALLPARLPDLADTDVSGRYLAGGDGMVVGGDFYDVITPPGRGVGVLLGDVMGRGVPAAGVMGAVRHTLRAYGSEGHPPGQVLERANRMLVGDETDQFATCCYAEYDPSAGTLVFARAGHPPPLLLPAQGPARLLDVEGGLPLALFPEASYPETTLVLSPGDTVVLYTDGLVERSGASIDDGLTALVAAADAVTGDGVRLPESLDGLVDRLLAALLPPGGTDDDIAVLALRRHGPAAGGPSSEVSRRFPDAPTSPGAARRFTADVLEQWELGGLVDTAALLVTEVVTNAVAHTVGDVALTLRREHGRLLVEAVDTDERLPEIQEPDDESQSGRGVWLVDALATEWGSDAVPGGKRVWFSLET